MFKGGELTVTQAVEAGEHGTPENKFERKKNYVQ